MRSRGPASSDPAGAPSPFDRAAHTTSNGAAIAAGVATLALAGMVITEALARGIPAIVPAGTGAVEAQGVGESFPPGDADALSAVLHGWLSDPELRQRWRDEAEKLRLQLPTWADTARIVAAALPAGASTVG